jgi:hypothetical protein
MPFAFIALAICVVGYSIAFTKKGNVRTDRMGSRRHEIFNPADIATVYARLSVLSEGKIRVDDKDDVARMIILSSPVTFGSWGFLYPVYLHATAHGTRIEIGCKSKFIQIGPLVTNWHNKAIAAVESALSIPQARVA